MEGEKASSSAGRKIKGSVQCSKSCRLQCEMNIDHFGSFQPGIRLLAATGRLIAQKGELKITLGRNDDNWKGGFLSRCFRKRSLSA